NFVHCKCLQGYTMLHSIEYYVVAKSGYSPFFVAETVGAIPCTKPSPYGLDLLAGSAESWTTLFPENGN
ncbi:MAG: hypothetical protein LC541_20650, partial [Candidatus Thiodiazotropha sp.]|nr:hypothetical protein [Candidatus Thiodiazotropha sp.]MCM8885673.1 hypothetical protein [Candidatus Thiodiazotropha sp.]